MSPKISKELSKHRLEQAKEELVAAKAMYGFRDGDRHEIYEKLEFSSEITKTGFCQLDKSTKK